MNKKTYKQPLVKAIELEEPVVLAGSDKISPMKLFSAPVEEYQGEEEEKPAEWGKQW